MDNTAFFLELQDKYREIDDIVRKYDLEKDFACIMVAGVLTPKNHFVKEFKGLYNYSIEDVVELEELIDFIYNSYAKENEQNRGLDDLLDGTGISLN